MFDKRAVATGFIWIVLAIMLDSIGGPAYRGDATAVSIALIVAALIGTIAIWGTIGDETRHAKPEAAKSEKAKRDSSDNTRMNLLLQLLDDGEKQRIKQRLLNDTGDGELSLEDLLAEQMVSDRHFES